MTTIAHNRVIQPHKLYVRKLVVGIRPEAEVSPCVFMYPAYPLQVLVTLKVKSGDSAGSAIVVDRSLDANTASQADVTRLLASVRVAPCKRCTTPAFDPSTVEANRGGLCEKLLSIRSGAEFANEQEAGLRRIAKRDRQLKQRV